MKAMRRMFPLVGLVLAITSMQGQQATRATNIERAVKVLSYENHSGIAKVEMQGTSMLPDAKGEAEIQRGEDGIDIRAEFSGLQPATRFGPEYLTYVIWAITPNGSATNLGEAVLDGMKYTLNASTQIHTFGLIVTAEPYFAVTQPGEVVVMENASSKDLNQHEQFDAKYQVLPTGNYVTNVSRSNLKPIMTEPDTPLDLYEARNAFWIAIWAGADKNAADEFDKAERSLQRAEAFHASGAGQTSVVTAARECVVAAESARALALKRNSDFRLSTDNAARRVEEPAA
jgi:hypothetical protein